MCNSSKHARLENYLVKTKASRSINQRLHRQVGFLFSNYFRAKSRAKKNTSQKVGTTSILWKREKSKSNISEILVICVIRIARSYLSRVANIVWTSMMLLLRAKQRGKAKQRKLPKKALYAYLRYKLLKLPLQLTPMETRKQMLWKGGGIQISSSTIYQHRKNKQSVRRMFKWLSPKGRCKVPFSEQVCNFFLITHTTSQLT